MTECKCLQIRTNCCACRHFLVKLFDYVSSVWTLGIIDRGFSCTINLVCAQ